MRWRRSSGGGWLRHEEGLVHTIPSRHDAWVWVQAKPLFVSLRPSRCVATNETICWTLGNIWPMLRTSAGFTHRRRGQQRTRAARSRHTPFMAYVVMAYVVMACVVMAYVVMACVVMVYIVVAEVRTGSSRRTRRSRRSGSSCRTPPSCRYIWHTSAIADGMSIARV